jgi:SAM-dependent methyltransferase
MLMNAVTSLLLAAARTPVFAPVMEGLLRLKLRNHPLNRPHPFDLAEGVETNGLVPGKYLFENEAEHTAYIGCTPSCVRAALSAIPNLEGAHFIDLGCGKGRALFVARSFPFATQTGVELSAGLAQAARRNAQRVMARRPGSPIEIVTGDATAPALPQDGDLVLFLYNPFRRAQTDELVRHLSETARQGRRLFVILENPVHGAAFDADPAFRRWYAATIPYAAEELGYGVDADEPVVIWANAAAGDSPHRADDDIAILQEDWRCALQPRNAFPSP